MKKLFVLFVVSVGFVGLIPFASGTFGSLIPAIAYYYFDTNLFCLAAFLTSTAIGFLFARPATECLNHKDPSSFVMDEVAGMFLAMLFLPPEPIIILTALLCFRMFDILKPFGIKRLDAMKHPSSIVLDDLLAGLYANLLTRLIAANFF